MGYKTLEITQEEKEALKAYCEWEHMYINLLTSGDMKAVAKFNVEELNIFSEEYFKKSMDVLRKIYSAMYKNSYGQQYGIRNLYRGTTAAEIKKLGNINTKMISTSKDEYAAKFFAGSKVSNTTYKEKDDDIGVILRINLGKNVPYINVNDILEEDSNHEREEEIIIAPFNKLNDLRHVSSWNGYEYYSIEMEEQELQSIENKGSLETEIIDEIGEIPEYVSIYVRGEDRLEVLSRWSANSIDMEDRKLISEERTQIYEQTDSVSRKFRTIREKIVQYAMGICYEEKERIEHELQEEKKQSREQSKKEQIDEVVKNINSARKSVETVVKTSDEFSRISSMLGLSFEPGVSNEMLNSAYNQLQENANEMCKKINGISIKSKTADAEITQNWQKIQDIEQTIQNIEEIANQYNGTNCIIQIKKQLGEKVNQLLKQAEIQSIYQEQQKLNEEEKQVGIIGRILGRDKEIELKKQQLMLKKNMLELEPEKDEESNVHVMVAKILAYKAQHNGELPEKLETMLTQIRQVFKLNDAKIEELLNQRLVGTALVQQERQHIFRRKTNMNLEQINSQLEERLQRLQQSAAQRYRESSRCNVPELQISQNGEIIDPMMAMSSEMREGYNKKVEEYNSNVTNIPQRIYASIQKTSRIMTTEEYSQVLQGYVLE